MKKPVNQKESILDQRDRHTLIESEERFRLIFENSHVGQSMTGIDGSLRVNKAFCNIVGYTENELKNKNWKEITHPEDIKESQDVVDRLLKGKNNSARYEKRYIHKNGSIIWTDVSTTLQKDPSGNPQYFITIISDITDFKESTKKLIISEERYKSFIEITGQIGWVTNPDGEVVEDIPSFRKFTGQSYDEVKGSGWASAIHPDDVEHTIKVWTESVSTKSSYETEYRIRRHDGKYCYFIAKGFPVLDKKGNIAEWIGTCIDITERKKAEVLIRDNEKRFRELIELLL